MGRDHGIAIRGFKRKRAKGGAQGKCPGAFIVGRADAGSLNSLGDPLRESATPLGMTRFGGILAV